MFELFQPIYNDAVDQNIAWIGYEAITSAFGGLFGLFLGVFSLIAIPNASVRTSIPHYAGLFFLIIGVIVMAISFIDL